MHKFVLRTRDAAWIERNNGATDAHGKTTFLVDAVERVTFAGVPHYRTYLLDVPGDVANCNVMCPAVWVDGS